MKRKDAVAQLESLHDELRNADAIAGELHTDGLDVELLRDQDAIAEKTHLIFDKAIAVCFALHRTKGYDVLERALAEVRAEDWLSPMLFLRAVDELQERAPHLLEENE